MTEDEPQLHSDETMSALLHSLDSIKALSNDEASVPGRAVNSAQSLPSETNPGDDAEDAQGTHADENYTF